MNNIILWSRGTDRKILATLGVICGLLFAAFVGSIIPSPGPSESFAFVNAAITTSLLLFIWLGFRLLRPIRYDRRWLIGEFIAVPLLWLLLVVALAIWFHHLHGASDEKIEILHQNILYNSLQATSSRADSRLLVPEFSR